MLGRVVPGEVIMAAALAATLAGLGCAHPTSVPGPDGQAGAGGSGGGVLDAAADTPVGGDGGSGGIAGTGGGGGTGGAIDAGQTGGTGGRVDAGGSGGSGGSGGTGGVIDAGRTGGTGGVAGTGGVGGTGGQVDAGVDAGPWRGPAPPIPGVRFPFPQNRESSRCIYPRGYLNEDLQAAYATWKLHNVTDQGAGGHLRVKRPNEPGLERDSTVSEGIAYGMMMAVYMNDQTLFDELWMYALQWMDGNGLMNWYINAAGTSVGSNPDGSGAATDADEDMAFALVMADRQWGGQGRLTRTYLDYARQQIQNIWDHEIWEGKLVRPGDGWGDWHTLNISYFAPSYYRIFKQVSGNQGWDAVVQTVYDTIANNVVAKNGNQDNGLVPAWSTSDGDPAWAPNMPFHYQYDSCRTPFRIALDWCWFGEERARAYVAKTSTFFSAIGVNNIADGYELDGRPRPEHGGRSASFIGPAGVGAMSSATYQSFVDSAYAAVATGQLLTGGTYYEESWTVLSLMMMTGNFFNLLDY